MKRWAAIARFGGVGDNLIAASPLRALKRMGYMTEVITSAPNHVVYLNNPLIDKLSVKNVERDLPKDLFEWQKWIESRAQEYDIFIHASHTAEGRHACFKSMSSFWWPQDYRRKLCAGSYLETVHDVAGVPYEFGKLFFTTPQEREGALETKKGIGERAIAWVLSGTRIDKVYPAATMAIARLIREVGPVLVIGGPNDKERSMAQAIKDNVIQFNGDRKGLHCAVSDDFGPLSWPLRTSLALVQACDVVVTPDTGTAWAVAFEPMPKVVMVSHASAENITKHWVNTTTLHADPMRVPCWPCHRLHDDPSTCVENKEKNGAACISDISVEDVVQAVARAWQQPSAVAHSNGPSREMESGGRSVQGDLFELFTPGRGGNSHGAQPNGSGVMAFQEKHA